MVSAKKGSILKFWDSLSNMVSGLGGEKDKTAFTLWTLYVLSQAQLDAAYRGDWMARKICDIPPDDATREWRYWQAEDEQIKLIEAEEHRLGIQQKTCDALTLARLYGGALMVMGIGDEDAESPLEIEKVKQGDLQFVHVLGRFDVGTETLERDPLSPYYGEPQAYTVNSQSKGSVKIHPSRVVRFMGNRVPTLAANTDGWGDSVLQSLAEAIKDSGATLKNIANLVFEAKVDIVNVPDLADTLSNDEYTTRLIERFSNANALKSVINTLVLNEDETWQRVQQTFTGLPEVAQLLLLCTCGAADIPATRFLGQSPTGLTATGESDIRNYYDKISSMQNMKIKPALKRLDNVLMVSALGKLDDQIYYDWAPLWQLDAVQKADVSLKQAQAFQVDVNANILDINSLRKARENQIIESETYPGFKGILDDQPEVPVLKEEAEPVIEQFGKAKEAQETRKLRRKLWTRDMQPKPLYVRRNVVNAKEIIAWAKAQGFRTTLQAGDMHVTICYSKAPVDWLKVGQTYPGGDQKGELTVAPGGPRIVEIWDTANGKGKVAVLQFASSELCWRHEDIKSAGASFDFPSYVPHITISYDVDGVDAEAIVPYRGKIVLGPEIFEEIDESWREKITEDKGASAESPLSKRVSKLEKKLDVKPAESVTKIDVQPVVEVKRPRKQKITKQKDGSTIVENLDED
jgi:phage-related protein (TIGR01555 family)